MIRCDSEADSTVWMEEDDKRRIRYIVSQIGSLLWDVFIPEFFLKTNLHIRDDSALNILFKAIFSELLYAGKAAGGRLYVWNMGTF